MAFQSNFWGYEMAFAISWLESHWEYVGVAQAEALQELWSASEGNEWALGKDSLYQTWYNITMEECQKVIETMHQRCKQVIKAKGYWIKFWINDFNYENMRDFKN